MSIVRQIDVIEKATSPHTQRPCTACYEVGRYLQLDTYASEDGRDAGSVKQTLRFEREGAARLLELLRLTFPDLVASQRG